MDLDLVYIQMAASDGSEEARLNGNPNLARAYDELAEAAGYLASMLEDEDD